MLESFKIMNRILEEFNNITLSELLTITPKEINKRIKENCDVNRITVRTLYTEKIGHFALNTEDFLRYYAMCEKEYKERKEIVLLMKDQSFCSNQQLLNMFKRRIPIVEGEMLIKLINLLAKDDPQLWELSQGRIGWGAVLDYNFFNDVSPQLAFTEEEEKRGQKLLEVMGIEKDAPFICFHNRDEVYINKVKVNNVWCTPHRNSSIKKYIPTVKYLAKQGYYCLRMGHGVEEPLELDDKRIIDYASKYRSDFGDIYLAAKCKFFLGCPSGIVHVAEIFNVPRVSVNFHPLYEINALNNYFFIPKKYWYIPEKRFLTFRELYYSNSRSWAVFIQNYSKLGIEVIENTSEEILDVTKEMVEFLNDTWKSTDEDEELQKCFREIYLNEVPWKTLPEIKELKMRFCSDYKEKVTDICTSSRIGTTFLRNNKYLLD